MTVAFAPEELRKTPASGHFTTAQLPDWPTARPSSLRKYNPAVGDSVFHQELSS